MSAAKTPRLERQTLGFSLVELIVVTLVISIIACIAIPRLSASLSSRRLQSAAYRVASDIAYARNSARDLGKNVQIDFVAATDSYSMPGVGSPNGDASYAVDLQQTPYPVTLASADFGGDGSVVFDLYGKPDSGGTVVVSGGGQSMSITLHELSGKTAIGP